MIEIEKIYQNALSVTTFKVDYIYRTSPTSFSQIIEISR